MTAQIPTIGWIGAGRMGSALASRVIRSGREVRIWNRTREKAEPLAALGATIVDLPSDLATCDVVVTMVSSSDVFEHVTLGEDGVLTREGASPKVLVDCSTISQEASNRVRAAAAELGTDLLDAPVSGNPRVAATGNLTLVVSGARTAFDLAEGVLATFGKHVTYVGEGDAARLVKICHNLLLGIVSQSLAEITVLAERGGVARSAFLEFLNSSVMGSVFTRYKTPAMVHLDFTPTFTGHLLRKDFELGLAVGRDLDVPLPTAALVHQLVMNLIGTGMGGQDFIALLEMEARGADHTLEPEDVEVSDGLEPIDDLSHEV
jgi:3-hydroxyisobutyrate dehydrogenase